jgi:HIRAN domain
MNRIDFIKGLVGSSIFGWMGLRGSDQTSKTKEAKVIYQSFVRGFVYSPCLSQLSSMKPNELLQIIREPDNEYDPFALALYHKNQKVGFVPAEDNYIISQLMDAGHGHFTAEIVNIDSHAPTWEQVEFRILSHQ